MDSIKKYYNSGNYLDEHKAYFRKYHIHQVDFLEKALKLTPKDEVADICCGNGRHAISLTKKSYKVHGFDYSKFLINEAKKLSAKENIQCDFYCQDVFKIEEKRKFNKLYWMFPDLSLDSKKIIRKCAKLLKKGSLALFDIRNVFNLAKFFYDTNDKNSVFDPKDFKLYTLSGKEKREKPDIFYTYQEIFQFCKVCKFKIVNVYGFYDFSEYQLFSPRMIFLLKKGS